MPVIIHNGKVYGGSVAVDTELLLDSTHPVENQAIAKAIKEIKDSEIPHWIGTQAELEAAIEAGEIEDGTIILITDSVEIDAVEYVSALPTGGNINNIIYGLYTPSTATAKVVSEGFLDDDENFVSTSGIYSAANGVEIQSSIDGVVWSDFVSLRFVDPDFALVQADGTYSLASGTDTFYYRTIEREFYAGDADRQATYKISNDEIEVEKIQYSVVPTAGVEYLNKIIEYVGETDSNYTKGFFYRCVSIPDTDPTEYEWVNQEVQESTDGEAFETAKSGVRSNADYTFEWDSDVLSVGDFTDLKSQWNDFAVFMHNNKGRLAMITIDQYDFGFSDDDTSGSSPTLICIIPDNVSISEDYSIRIPYGSATSIHGDGYGSGFIDISWRLSVSSGKCDFAGINTTLFKGTDSMSTGYAYFGSSASSVYINETEYSMNDASERAAAYDLYHQGVSIIVKLL